MKWCSTQCLSLLFHLHAIAAVQRKQWLVMAFNFRESDNLFFPFDRGKSPTEPRPLSLRKWILIFNSLPMHIYVEIRRIKFTLLARPPFALSVQRQAQSVLAVNMYVKENWINFESRIVPTHRYSPFTALLVHHHFPLSGPFTVCWSIIYSIQFGDMRR